jgi:hypothetical protein
MREVDALALKRRAFDIVLRVEEKHLPHVGRLIADLRAELARMTVGRGSAPSQASEPAAVST